MKQSELYENVQDVRSNCFAKQKFEPCEILKDLGICVPWKDSFFVNWKTQDNHLGMDFATYISKARYNDLCRLAEILHELAQHKRDYDSRDWDFDIETLFRFKDVEADTERRSIHAKITIKGIEYSVFYDSSDLVISDKSGKEAEFDSNFKLTIISALETILDDEEDDEEDDDEPEHCEMDCMACQNYYAGLCSECDGSNMYYEGN